MTTKRLEVMETEPTEFVANLSLTRRFEPTIASRDRHSFREHEAVNELELDRYQIALVPFRAGQSRIAGTSPPDGSVSQLLLLPFTWRELVTQVRKEMRRPSSTKDGNVVGFGQVRIDLSNMEVRRGDRLVNLTAMEFKVLKFFVLNPNRVISRDDLLNQVWGYDNYPCTRTVDNHVLRLRQKLEVEFARPIHFRTVHGMGYKFVP